ncbi:MAG: glycosyl transferase [Alphaproteobacteria bacterium]|nr:MAG: glycosyl transferase [Alphaproteobacteria bacterium]
MLVHRDFGRVAQVARHWARHGCPVVIHVDAKVPEPRFEALRAAVADWESISFSPRRRCEWGTFAIVEATQLAAEQMLERHPSVSHVYLASGSCLPIRPVADLIAYLGANPGVDFIESVTTDEVTWTVGGFDRERFTLYFPFSWKRRRKLFDAFVALQRRIGIERTVPADIEPHLGSQWWCLTRRTLTAILENPRRAEHERYFRRVWIPDESYFQSLARNFSSRIESRSLTLSKFDHQGKPYIFYDDHLELLERSGAFVARKIWPRAERLYRHFLREREAPPSAEEPDTARLDQVFARAVRRRTRGRDGLVNQGRLPRPDLWGLARTAAPYTVFQGLDDLFEDFAPWIERRTGARVHGHLFHRARAQFAGGEQVFAGGLSANARLRDYDPGGFLRNLIWATRGETQAFMFGPGDNQAVLDFMVHDPNARFFVVSGAWAVRLFHSNLSFARIRKIAARYQKAEAEALARLQAHYARAHVRVWSLAEFVQEPMTVLQTVLDETTGGSAPRLTEVPRMVDLTGFGSFIKALRNRGMNPYLVGEFSEPGEGRPRRRPRPVLVRG